MNQDGQRRCCLLADQSYYYDSPFFGKRGPYKTAELAKADAEKELEIIKWFDNHEMAEYFDLTTIEQPVHMLGEMAAWSIMEKLKKPDSDLPDLTLPTSLIVRNSTRKITAE